MGTRHPSPFPWWAALIAAFVGMKICLTFFTASAASPAECNPLMAATLSQARRAGDAFTMLTLPDLGRLESADVKIGGHERKVILLLKWRINLNIFLSRSEQHRDADKPTLSINGLTSFEGTDLSGFGKVETYFAASGDAVTDLIQCSPPGSAPSPGCSHWITDGPLTIQADYGRDWLPKWHAIRETVTTAIDHCGGP